MTNAEKQEIIEAVLAALATNSKTIAQLTPKQSLTDSDLFEVAGGSRVTYLVLKNAIREGLALASQLSDYLTEENAAMYLAKLDTETGTIDFRESPCVMLDGFKDVNGYTPVTGDLFYENRSGYQIWTKTQGGATGEHANTHVAYINRNENAFYRWTGTKMERIGGCTVVNDLVTGGEGDALSAEMGMTLRIAIETILDNLGDYAFPNGKPTLSWEGSMWQVQQNLNNLTSDFESLRIADGEQLDIELSPSSNLYVIDDDSVTVMMGGEDITETAYLGDGVISIPSVDGKVVITAAAITYEQTGLAFMLDCKNRGGTSGNWKDLIGNKDFALTNVTEADTGMVFNGTSSKAEYGDGSLAITHGNGTIEFVMEPKGTVVNGDMVLWNGYNGGIGAGFWDYNSNVGISPVFNINAEAGSKFVPSATEPACASINAERALLDGQLVTPTTDQTIRWILTSNVNTGKMHIGCRYKSSGWVYCSMTIKAIRVYNTQLTEAQMRKNYAIDKKRFNLS